MVAGGVQAPAAGADGWRGADAEEAEGAGGDGAGRPGGVRHFAGRRRLLLVLRLQRALGRWCGLWWHLSVVYRVPLRRPGVEVVRILLDDRLGHFGSVPEGVLTGPG